MHQFKVETRTGRCVQCVRSTELNELYCLPIKDEFSDFASYIMVVLARHYAAEIDIQLQIPLLMKGNIQDLLQA